ncbi:DUF4393 domain-containing protein [Weissella paramesenteroides]|uniref:DUF4393 domain-containing protein n=1 Tax=Weissella paramesenteroides TaxID=1249 RepID=UPI00223AAA38|nr:DUF4393 domain-containing protein [Weissella paramesenteroides]MCS9983965.1 DUF4393 domain-containing protein [Weissella paramesenteroides]MCS9998977.1 DUF4393 domain-containing protein [Weissella paramesenteroides]MCT0259320.1 DUF4393 domain-containing protein [Weissella paramesenteroides]
MDPNDLKNFFDLIPEDSRNYLLKPSFKNIGTVINGIFLDKYEPLVINGLIKQNQIDQLKSALNKKLSDIPEEKLDNSNSLIAIRALEELRYQMNSDTLIEMFANLISNSFNSDYNKSVQNLFVHIIGNMSHETAVLLEDWQFIRQESTPYAYITRKNEDGTYCLITSSIIAYFDYKATLNKGTDNITQSIQIETKIIEVPQELSELEYLGLVKISDGTYQPSSGNIYQMIANKYNATIADILDRSESESSLYLNRGIVELTPLGKSFCNVILNQHH